MAEHERNWDTVDGAEVAPRIVTGAEQVSGTHQGSIYVEPAASLEVIGSHQGSVTFEPGSSGLIIGQHQGSLHVAAGAVVTVRGTQQGSVRVAPSGVVKVEPQGRLTGSLHNDGLIENSGTRGGSVDGSGVLHDLAGSAVKQPVAKDGALYYSW